jgi:ribosomal protein L25 (general stress protein Ctc)
MANIDAPVKLEQRTVLGKGLGHLRQDGIVPAVIHNHGQESVHVMGPEMELVKIYQAAGKHHPLNLEVGSDKYLALIKDAHFDPVKRRLQHVVFQAIKQDEKVEAEHPIATVAESRAMVAEEAEAAEGEGEGAEEGEGQAAEGAEAEAAAQEAPKE